VTGRQQVLRSEAKASSWLQSAVTTTDVTEDDSSSVVLHAFTVVWAGEQEGQKLKNRHRG